MLALVRILAGAAAVSCPALWGSTIYTTGGIPAGFDTLPANAWQIGPTQTFMALAESFVPSTTQQLGAIDIAVGWVSGSGNILVEIASSSGGRPGSILESLTGSAPATASMVTLSSVVHPTLNAHTTYWLVLTATNTLDTYWFTASTTPRGVDIDISSSWVSSSGSTKGAADIQSGSATAPEPASLTMLAIGIAGVWFGRKRRCRRVSVRAL